MEWIDLEKEKPAYGQWCIIRTLDSYHDKEITYFIGKYLENDYNILLFKNDSTQYFWRNFKLTICNCCDEFTGDVFWKPLEI